MSKRLRRTGWSTRRRVRRRPADQNFFSNLFLCARLTALLTILCSVRIVVPSRRSPVLFGGSRELIAVIPLVVGQPASMSNSNAAQQHHQQHHQHHQQHQQQMRAAVRPLGNGLQLMTLETPHGQRHVVRNEHTGDQRPRLRRRKQRAAD